MRKAFSLLGRACSTKILFKKYSDTADFLVALSIHSNNIQLKRLMHEEHQMSIELLSKRIVRIRNEYETEIRTKKKVSS